MVIVNQHCMICGDNSFSWKSQPMMFNGRYPAGNVLLSFSILMAGASISKILLVFKHMGLSAYNARTFFFHQKNFQFPAVLSYWERYQAALIEKIKNTKDAVWSGDGRFDSMGHSAKFGVYTLFCNTILKVVHFELLQVRLNNFSEPKFCSTSYCTGTFFLLLILFHVLCVCVTTSSFEQFFLALVHFFSSLQFLLPNSPSRISWSILSWEVGIT